MSQEFCPKAILFDWDNTLVESWHILHEALRRTLTEYGRAPISLAETRQMTRQSARESFPAIFGTTDAEQAIAQYRQHYTEIRGIPRVSPHAEEVLQQLRKQNIPCGVVSNKNHNLLQDEIATLGWQEFFALGAIGADKATLDKPSPRVLEELLGEMPAKEVLRCWWYVGDTGIDVEFARISGMFAVLVGDNRHQDDPVPDRGVADLGALQILLKEWA